ncbi:MAG TPA: hypothetical protein VF489_02355 [Sphingobium sp.]
MSRGKTLLCLVGLALLAGFIGSIIGAVLLYLYGLMALYWELYQETGKHIFDLGASSSEFKDSVAFGVKASIILTTMAALMTGAPLAYGLKNRILAYPKTSVLTLTVLGGILAVVLMKLIFRHALGAGFAPHSVFFGAATAFAYSLLIVGFGRRLAA